jgi:hypothetical protein
LDVTFARTLEYPIMINGKEQKAEQHYAIGVKK